MNLLIIPYSILKEAKASDYLLEEFKIALSASGIVAVSGVPGYEGATESFFKSYREFSALDLDIKKLYEPTRKNGDYTGFEIGVEQYTDPNGQSLLPDDKKASYYAMYPDDEKVNRWPKDSSLQPTFNQLAKIMYDTGMMILKKILFDSENQLDFDRVTGFGRMLHYHKERNGINPDWCGGHYDHGLFTALAPARYYSLGQRVPEPEEAGLHIVETRNFGKEIYSKVPCDRDDLLLFQVGEFGQLISNDRIRATKHIVKKDLTDDDIERFTMALFFSPDNETKICSSSSLAKDTRFSENKQNDGTVRYEDWSEASYARYLKK